MAEDASAVRAPPELAEARRLYGLAAAHGDVVARHNLAVMMERGEGGPEDLAEARRLFGLAAAQGCAEAQCHLGVLLLSGKGGARDGTEGRRLLTLAAAQGCAVARHNLQVVASREGVPQERERAATARQPERGQTADPTRRARLHRALVWAMQAASTARDGCAVRHAGDVRVVAVSDASTLTLTMARGVTSNTVSVAKPNVAQTAVDAAGVPHRVPHQQHFEQTLRALLAHATLRALVDRTCAEGAAERRDPGSLEAQHPADAYATALPEECCVAVPRSDGVYVDPVTKQRNLLLQDQEQSSADEAQMAAAVTLASIEDYEQSRGSGKAVGGKVEGGKVENADGAPREKDVVEAAPSSPPPCRACRAGPTLEHEAQAPCGSLSRATSGQQARTCTLAGRVSFGLGLDVRGEPWFEDPRRVEVAVERLKASGRLGKRAARPWVSEAETCFMLA